MKILIVDDSNFMRTILRNIIHGSNYGDAEILEAANGEEAVAKYNAEKPDLILLDIIMPGKDGLTVLKEIGPAAKAIVVVSSVDQPQIIEQAKSLGAKGYVIKPYDAKEVISTLETIM